MTLHSRKQEAVCGQANVWMTNEKGVCNADKYSDCC